jgi:hypothetical protein
MACLFDLFGKCAGRTIALNAQGPCNYESIIPFRRLDLPLVPQRTRPELREGTAVEIDEVVLLDSLAIH